MDTPSPPAPNQSAAPPAVDTHALRNDLVRRAADENKQTPGYRPMRKGLAVLGAVFAVVMGAIAALSVGHVIDGSKPLAAGLRAAALTAGLGAVVAAISRRWWKGHAPLPHHEHAPPALPTPQRALNNTDEAL